MEIARKGKEDGEWGMGMGEWGVKYFDFERHSFVSLRSARSEKSCISFSPPTQSVIPNEVRDLVFFHEKQMLSVFTKLARLYYLCCWKSSVNQSKELCIFHIVRVLLFDRQQ